MRIRLAIILILALSISGGPNGAEAPNDRFASGLAKFNAGQWQDAATQLALAGTQYPANIAIRLTAGVALANVKRYSEAIEHFKAASALQPDSPLPKFLLDGTYSELGKASLARQNRNAGQRLLKVDGRLGSFASQEKPLTDSLGRYPKNAIAHCLLGDLYQLQGRTALAKPQYEEASRLAPKWTKPIFNLGIANLADDPKAAQLNFDKVAAMDPSNSRVFLWQGDAYLRQGNVTGAMDSYQNAAKDKGLAAEANVRMGNAQYQAGNYVQAQQNFDVAVKNAPQDPRAIAGRAQALEKSGDYVEAENQYQQAAKVLTSNDSPAPSQRVVQNQIANVQAVQAGTVIDGACVGAVAKPHPTLSNYALTVKTHASENRLDQGIQDAENALAKNPKDVQTLLYLLAAYGLKGNQLGRIDIATRLCKVDPAYAVDYYAEMGSAYLCLGNKESAAGAYRNAFESGSEATWPDTINAAKRAGALALVVDSYQQSFDASGKVRDGLILMDLQRAAGSISAMIDTGMDLVKSNPNEPTLWLRLGEAHEQSGNTSMAELAYSRVLESSNHAAVAVAKARLKAIRGK